MIFLMVLSGFAGGIRYSMAPGYTYSIVDEWVRHSAQTFADFATTFASVMGTLCGGCETELFGIDKLTFVCGIINFGLTAFCVICDIFYSRGRVVAGSDSGLV